MSATTYREYAAEHLGWVQTAKSDGEREILRQMAQATMKNSMEFRCDPAESAKSHFFDTSSWGEFCDVTLTLKQGHQPDSGGWVKIEDYRCRQAFRHFMNLLNRAVYGSAFRRYGGRTTLP
jgi:hypothetical protein